MCKVIFYNKKPLQCANMRARRSILRPLSTLSRSWQGSVIAAVKGWIVLYRYTNGFCIYKGILCMQSLYNLLTYLPLWSIYQAVVVQWLDLWPLQRVLGSNPGWHLGVFPNSCGVVKENYIKMRSNFMVYVWSFRPALGSRGNYGRSPLSLRGSLSGMMMMMMAILNLRRLFEWYCEHT